LKNLIIKPATLCLLAITASTSTSTIHANENIFYGGIGSAKSDSSSVNSDKTPFSLGYIMVSEKHKTIWGFDLSREGTLLDSTYGQNKAVRQGISYNLLFGTNLARTESSRFDIAVLLGAREKTMECPSSYLGYQCYANASPETEFGFNYGAVLTWSFNSVMVGMRATGESTQALIGLKF
jgi:hypothetical protein